MIDPIFAKLSLLISCQSIGKHLQSFQSKQQITSHPPHVPFFPQRVIIFKRKPKWWCHLRTNLCGDVIY